MFYILSISYLICIYFVFNLLYFYLFIVHLLWQCKCLLGLGLACMLRAEPLGRPPI